MNNDVFVFLILVVGVSVTTNIALAVGLWRTSRRLRTLEQNREPLPDARSDRIEQAVEGLASQVDALASGQDFLNRVLADRLDRMARPLPGIPEHESTPH